MTKSARAGATALVAGPLIGLVTTLVVPTLSDRPADVVSATNAHHAGMLTFLALEPFGIALVIAGIVWLTAAVRPHSPRLALAGGIVGVAGGLVILFEDGVAAVGPSLVNALRPTAAATALHQIHSGGVTAVEPLALLLDVGLALLGFAAVKAGVARWVAVVLTVSVLAEGIAHPAASRPLLAVGFVGMFAMLGVVVHGLQMHRAQSTARESASIIGAPTVAR